jgi:prepilin-type N-terminal cleavage/methylation domain-containing protein
MAAIPVVALKFYPQKPITDHRPLDSEYLMNRLREKAFTLAELLIALVILGVIAAFTIPKVLQSQQSQEWKATTKEASAMVSGAFQAYLLANKVSTATEFADLTPYMNYVALDTSSQIDRYYNSAGTFNCGDAGEICLRLHNGTMLRGHDESDLSGYDGNDAVHAMFFEIDPDGKVTTDGSATSPGKCVILILYANGRLTTWGTINNPTYVNLTKSCH